MSFLVELWEFETEIVSDFHSIYHGKSPFDMGKTYSGREAIILLNGLLLRPDSLYYAKKLGWTYAISRESLILSDIFDILVSANTPEKAKGQLKPYPRPFDTGTGTKRKGTVLSAEEIMKRYTVERSNASEEEIKEHNRLFMEKQKEAQNGEV